MRHFPPFPPRYFCVHIPGREHRSDATNPRIDWARSPSHNVAIAVFRPVSFSYNFKPCKWFSGYFILLRDIFMCVSKPDSIANIERMIAWKSAIDGESRGRIPQCGLNVCPQCGLDLYPQRGLNVCPQCELNPCLRNATVITAVSSEFDMQGVYFTSIYREIWSKIYNSSSLFRFEDTLVCGSPFSKLTSSSDSWQWARDSARYNRGASISILQGPISRSFCPMLLVERVKKRSRRSSRFETYPTCRDANFAHQIANSVWRESATPNVELSAKRIRGIIKSRWSPSPPGKSALEINSDKNWPKKIACKSCDDRLASLINTPKAVKIIGWRSCGTDENAWRIHLSRQHNCAS